MRTSTACKMMNAAADNIWSIRIEDITTASLLPTMQRIVCIHCTVTQLDNAMRVNYYSDDQEVRQWASTVSDIYYSCLPQ